MIQIKHRIVDFKLKEEPINKPTVQKMHEGIIRPESIPGRTYKIKLPGEEYATYVTINNIVLNEGTTNEEIRPFEIFINSKNTAHRQWVDTLTRVISAVFRKGGEITFLVEELKSISDPNGGGWYKGRFVRSLVSEIGFVLEKHIEEVKYVPSGVSIKSIENVDSIEGARKCLACGAKAVVQKDGCPTCLACGDSKCG